MILALPILIIALFAVVEFGLLISNEQYLEMSSRAGAEVAAEFPTLPEPGDTFPTEIRDAVNDVLNARGLPNAREIRLEHNVNPPDPPPNTGFYIVRDKAVAMDPDCPDPTNEPPSPANIDGVSYVRITVCVNTTSLTPNLLRTFGFDISGRVSRQTTTRRYEQ